MTQLYFLNDILNNIVGFCSNLSSVFNEVNLILLCSGAIVVSTFITILVASSIKWTKVWDGVKWVLVPAIVGVSNGIASTITKDQLDKNKKGGNNSGSGNGGSGTSGTGTSGNKGSTGNGTTA